MAPTSSFASDWPKSCKPFFPFVFLFVCFLFHSLIAVTPRVAYCVRTAARLIRLVSNGDTRLSALSLLLWAAPAATFAVLSALHPAKRLDVISDFLFTRCVRVHSDSPDDAWQLCTPRIARSLWAVGLRALALDRDDVSRCSSR